MWTEARPRASLNFLLTGNDAACLSFVRKQLNKCPGLFCHGEVLHAKHHVRGQAHCDYLGNEIAKDGELVFQPYGCSPSPIAGEWQPDDPRQSPDKYLSHAIFDNALHGETHIGVQVSYADLLRLDLWDFIGARSREGDFCVIEVARNPVAALADNALQDKRAVYLDVASVITACDTSHTAQSRLHAVASDRAFIDFRELLETLKETMQALADYLVIAYPADAHDDRLCWQNLRPRIANWPALYHSAPKYVQDIMSGRNFASFY